jgi:hypothetical protein
MLSEKTLLDNSIFEYNFNLSTFKLLNYLVKLSSTLKNILNILFQQKISMNVMDVF